MRCYHCGAELSEHSFCTNCGVDVGLYKKIIRLSNTFYNQGLEKARVRDLSGAVVCLRQSLKFNKNNIKARNLLGLVYYEMGEVVAALSEWVISTNLRSKKNVAADYIERLQSNVSKMDVLKQSIKKYNQAYQYCLQPDGKDLAIVQLKSVIRFNPKYVRAYQLLGLVYLVNGNPKAARHYLLIAKDIDINSTITLRYLKEAERMLNPDDPKKAKKNENNPGQYATVTKNDAGDTIIQPNYVQEKRGSGTVLNIIIGLAIGFAIAYFLVLPGRISAAQDEYQAKIRENGVQIDALNLEIADLQKTNSDQENKIKTLTDSLSAYSGTEGTLADMENILKAAAVHLQNPENQIEVAEYLLGVDEEAWTEDTSENYRELYLALKSAIGPTVCETYYMDGNKALQNKQYDDAIAYLTAAVFFDAGNVDALYALATAYNDAEQTEDAKQTYEKVIELFPNTWYSTKAEQYINSHE
ncbi:MAG: tetratricopeptide repeat protein [Lachnospiraceae bacterium]|nr:tetratricopeptide repeat protein [Lachnospiraceae bacterium]